MSKVTKGWSEERRRQQAENIRKTKPWLKTTGPKTQSGKQVVKNNAYKHGFRSEDYRALCALLRLQEAVNCGKKPGKHGFSDEEGAIDSGA